MGFSRQDSKFTQIVSCNVKTSLLIIHTFFLYVTQSAHDPEDSVMSKKNFCVGGYVFSFALEASFTIFHLRRTN